MCDLAVAVDNARFAPSGGNRQGWRVVVAKDPQVRANLRDLYLEGWYEKYANDGFTIVGVHSPEFPFEHDSGNVASAIKANGTTILW